MFQQEISNAELDKKHWVRSMCRDCFACFGCDMKHPDFKEPESCGGNMLQNILGSDSHVELTDRDIERMREAYSMKNVENV